MLDGICGMLHLSKAEWNMKFVTAGDEPLSACGERHFNVVVSVLRMQGTHNAIIADTLPVKREIRKVTVVAALLHNAEPLALASSMTDHFLLLLDQIERSNCSQVEADEALFGISHVEIGAHLLCHGTSIRLPSKQAHITTIRTASITRHRLFIGPLLIQFTRA